MGAPTATWFAPGRVTLIGDHTDYTGGWVLAFALTLGITVTVDLTVTGNLTVRSTRFPGAVHRRALPDLAPARSPWAVYVEGAVALLRDRGFRLDGVDVRISGDLPSASGLASSAALVCGTLGALADASGTALDPADVAELAQRVENDFVGAPVGFLDPAVVVHGRVGQALLLDCSTREVSTVPMAADGSGHRLLVVDTGQPHTTAGPVYAERVAQCGAAARQLGVPSLRQVADVDRLAGIDDEVLRRRARHVVTENGRVLAAAAALQAGDIDALGPLMLASHASLRDDYQVSTSALDRVVDSSVAAGATGARLTGAGMGGCALVLVERRHESTVRAAVADAFATAGDAAPTVVAVRAGGGAHAVSARVS